MSSYDDISIDALKTMPIDQIYQLAHTIREIIIETVAKNGGHLSSNLGNIELTLALHYVFHSPTDKFIFDTSHQSYTHKIITGRIDHFSTLRQFGGISGFTHPHESSHDHFFSGHAGTALSLGLGLAKNRDHLHEEAHILPIIGDGSLNCGLTLEALNHIPKDLKNFIVILNDNEMAISKNVGNITNILSRLVNNPTSNRLNHEIQELLKKIPKFGSLLAVQEQKLIESIKNLVSPAPFFEQFGLSYIGPIDGYNIEKLIDTFTKAKNLKRPLIVHVLTQKGKGLKSAAENPTLYHGVKSFNPKTGKIAPSSSPTFPQIFGKMLVQLAATYPDLFAISPAMIEGSCMSEMMNAYPDRCFDTGIAEGHALTFAGGLCYKKNTKVLICVYSTFLQRAFDNLYHDICLQNLPVIIAIDRAGINGPDGVTHHGIYDISFLQTMPNLIIAQPRNGQLLKELMQLAMHSSQPFAIRYPNRKTEESNLPIHNLSVFKAEILQQGEDIVIIAVGDFYKLAQEVSLLLQKEQISSTIIDPIFLKPLDEHLFQKMALSHTLCVTLEEHTLNGGFGSIFNTFLLKNQIATAVLNFGIEDQFVQHGDTSILLQEIGLDAKSIANKIAKVFNKRKKECHDYSCISS